LHQKDIVMLDSIALVVRQFPDPILMVTLVEFALLVIIVLWDRQRRILVMMVHT